MPARRGLKWELNHYTYKRPKKASASIADLAAGFVLADDKDRVAKILGAICQSMADGTGWDREKLIELFTPYNSEPSVYGRGPGVTSDSIDNVRVCTIGPKRKKHDAA